jgi:hypothetical protein
MAVIVGEILSFETVARDENSGSKHASANETEEQRKK